eukprot:3716628-Rhodomonas_salina.1
MALSLPPSFAPSFPPLFPPLSPLPAPSLPLSLSPSLPVAGQGVRLYSFYTKYCPEKLVDIEKLLKHFHGA